MPSTRSKVVLVSMNGAASPAGRPSTSSGARCGVPEQARVAVLINNFRSSAAAPYWARTIDRAVTKDWFVFPWEQMAKRDAVVAEALSVPDRLA